MPAKDNEVVRWLHGNRCHMEDNHFTSLAEFFLDIARMELEQLRGCSEPVTLGSDGYSAHFRHAVSASVFSAFAVEHAITELIWMRCFFQSPEGWRPLAVRQASLLRTMPAKLDFIRAATRLRRDLLDDIKALFEYRNRIAHARVQPFEGGVLDFEEMQELIQQGRAEDLDKAIERALSGRPDALSALADEHGKKRRSLELPAIGTPDLDEAGRNFDIAQRAVEAIRGELGSKDWPLTR